MFLNWAWVTGSGRIFCDVPDTLATLITHLESVYYLFILPASMAADWHHRNWHGVDQIFFLFLHFFLGVRGRLRTTELSPIEAARTTRAQRRRYIDEGADAVFWVPAAAHNT